MVWSWAQGCLLASTIPVVPITCPTAQLSILPQNHQPKGADPASALLPPAPHPPPSQAHRARGAASAAPLATTALPFAAGMVAGGRASGCRGCTQQRERGTNNPSKRGAKAIHSKERGAQTAHSPSEEGHGGLSTHRCLTEPTHVQATCSPLQCSHLTHPLCTSLLPSGVAITAEARKQLRACFKTGRDPVPLQLGGWARGSVPPSAHSPSTGRSCSPSAWAQHLCRPRGGHAQGQCVPKTCSTSGMRQQGWGKEGLPSRGSSLPQCLPDPRRALPAAKAQPGQAAETLGQNTWGGKEGGRAASRGTRYLPHPSTPAW